MECVDVFIAVRLPLLSVPRRGVPITMGFRTAAAAAAAPPLGKTPLGGMKSTKSTAKGTTTTTTGTTGTTGTGIKPSSGPGHGWSRWAVEGGGGGVGGAKKSQRPRDAGGGGANDNDNDGRQKNVVA